MWLDKTGHASSQENSASCDWIKPATLCPRGVCCSELLQSWDINCFFLFRGSFLWRNSPSRAWASLLLRFPTHTELDTHPLGLLWRRDQPVAEACTSTTMPSAGFEPAITEIEHLQTYVLDRGIGPFRVYVFCISTTSQIKKSKKCWSS
jgi:hypothetical protein